jgi:transposase
MANFGKALRLRKAIESHDGDLTGTANALGVTRQTAHRWVREYNLQGLVAELRTRRRSRAREDKVRSMSWMVRHDPSRARAALTEALWLNRGIVQRVAVACKVRPRTVYDWCRKFGLEPRDYRDR